MGSHLPHEKFSILIAPRSEFGIPGGAKLCLGVSLNSLLGFIAASTASSVKQFTYSQFHESIIILFETTFLNFQTEQLMISKLQWLDIL